MIRTAAVLYFFLSSFAFVGAAEVAPANAFLEVSDVEAGEHFQHTTFEALLNVTNHSQIPAEIEVKPVRKKDRVLKAPKIVGPGESATVVVLVDAADLLGTRSHPFSISAQEPFAGVVARVNVFVYSVLEEPRLAIDFGVVDLSEKQEPRTIAIESREIDDFRITGIEETPPFVTATLDPDGRHVSVAIKKDTAFGQQTGYLKLRTNFDKQPQAWVLLNAVTNGDIVPSSNPFAIDVARTGQQNEYAIVLENRRGKPLKIKSARVTGFVGEARVQECLAKRPDCKQVRFTVDGSQPTGQIAGQVLIAVRGQKHDVPVGVWGVLLNPNTQVVSLNDKLDEAAAAAPEGASTQAPVIPRLSDEIKQAVSIRPQGAVSEGVGPLIRWSVDNEKTIHSYHIFRGDAEDGPFRRVNSEFIYVMSKDETGSSYAWRDGSVSSGKAYWYYVGYVQKDGRKIQLTSPQMVVAK